ncbi:uncharacterized protein LOC135874250 [Emys orbicularis]|uniref:uncharacterized protein LOC135874250 n=1 Tax=Emys orbicularis TaxID=82168 RepID=UPI0031FC9DD8
MHCKPSTIRAGRKRDQSLPLQQGSVPVLEMHSSPSQIQTNTATPLILDSVHMWACQPFLAVSEYYVPVQRSTQLSRAMVTQQHCPSSPSTGLGVLNVIHHSQLAARIPPGHGSHFPATLIFLLLALHTCRDIWEISKHDVMVTAQDFELLVNLGHTERGDKRIQEKIFIGDLHSHLHSAEQSMVSTCQEQFFVMDERCEMQPR